MNLTSSYKDEYIWYGRQKSWPYHPGLVKMAYRIAVTSGEHSRIQIQGVWQADISVRCVSTSKYLPVLLLDFGS